MCNKENCLIREQYYLDTLKPKYNICKVAGNTLGIKSKLEVLIKNSKSIDVFDLQGNFIKNYYSISEAARNLNINNSSITQAIKNKGYAYKYQFRYAGEFLKLTPYSNPLKIKIICYNKNGVFFKIFNSILEASKELNIPVGNISKHINSIGGKICYGYIFKKYIDNFSNEIKNYEKKHKYQKKVKIINLQTNEEFIFNSLRSISEKFYFNRSNLIKRLKNNTEKYIIIKNKFKVEIITCNSNEVTETN